MRRGANTMNLKRTIGLILVIAGVILGVSKALGSDTQSGDWTIRRSDIPGKVEFSLMDSRAGHHYHTSSEWPATDFSGLDFSKTGRQEVHFTIARDAGKFECEGFLHDGEGAGLFHFVADAKYAQEMKTLGFGGIDAEKQWAMAIHDVSLKFARDIKAKNLQGLDADKLIAFHIHGVTPEMVRSLKQAGYEPDADKLIAMRIHGATPEWVEDLKKQGYDHVDLDKLIAFRIHGVSPDFIGQLKKLGYAHPEPDQLIAMRIHGVTPDFISSLQSRGMKDLSIDKLVSLKIHGID